MDGTARLARLEERVERLEAAEAIRQGIYRCAKAIDRGDIALLKSCYHPGATEVHWIYIGEAQGFAEFIVPELAPFRVIRHGVSNPLIQLAGERAFAETQYWGIAMLDLPEEGEGVFAEHHSFGRYLDVWERREGEWRIAHRHLTDDGGSTRLMTGQTPPAFDPVRSAQHAPHDPSYSGFAIADHCPPPIRRSGLADSIALTARKQVPESR